MTAAPTAIAIIPVRAESQRLPGKALLDATGQALFLHTWQQARRAARFDGVWIATDSDAVAAAAAAAGAPVVRTSARPRTGSERCAEALAQLAGEVIVDVQGDWPEIDPRDLEALVAAVEAGADSATLAVPLADGPAADDPNVVKVVRGLGGDALYFSRLPIPYARGAGGAHRLRHVGVYAFRRDVLARIPELPSSGLAETESLEQLRLLENGITMRVVDAVGDPWGIETRADYDAFVQRRLATREGTT